MLNIIAVKDGKFNSHTNTIIGTQCSTLSCQPVAVDFSLNSILMEVKLNVNKFVAYHIHMALNDGSSFFLVTWSSWNFDEDIASLVDFSLKIMAFTKGFQILYHLLLVLAWARNLIDVCELLKYASRFQIIFIHLFMLFYFVLFSKNVTFATE